MNILFCNIAWMKNYEGVYDDDKPKNGGAYVDENEYGNECFNFQDCNGKCYGFVMLKGDMNLKLHYKEAKKHDAYIEDVLVVWVATNDKNETRIVGWYKNATVYSVQKYQEAFTNESFDLCYNMVADAKNCYLIPEEERTFPIQRAAQTGTGTGMGRSNVWYAESNFAKTVLIPKVIEYIDNYKGEFANSLLTNEILSEVIEDKKLSNDYKKLYDEGTKFYEENDFITALRFFNTARLIKETPELLFDIAGILKSLCCFDRAIPIFEKVIELEEDKLYGTRGLMECYDCMGNREKTIEYCNKLFKLFDDSEAGKDAKKYLCSILFYVYIDLKDKKNSRAIIDKISVYSDDEEVKKFIEEMKNIVKEEFDK